MAGQPGFFDGEERLKALSGAGDPLERLSRVVDFKVFVTRLRGCCHIRSAARETARPTTLSDAAINILDAMAELRTNEHIFPGRRNAPIASTTLLQLLKKGLGCGDITVHGFRSTFRDWAGETTNNNFPPNVCEAALAHAKGNKVAEAYQRGDLFRKRRKLMDAWASHCAAPATNGAVVPMRRRQ